MTKTILIASMVLSTVLLGGLMTDDAFAAVDMFMKIEGVPGESKDDAHSDEIDVLSWSWGMSQSGSFHTGGGGGSGKVNVQDLSFTKNMGKASPSIMQFCCEGEHLSEAKLTFCRATSTPEEHCYLEIKLTNVMITSVSYGGSSGEEPTENVTLNFAKVKMEYKPQRPDGEVPPGEKEFSTSDWKLKGKKILEN